MGLQIKYEDQDPQKPHSTIELTNGFIALVNTEDYENLNQYKWFAKKSNVCWYAVRLVKSKNSSYLVRMHRQITHCIDGLVVHHKNHNSLDNRKSNLILLTPDQHLEFHPGKHF